MNINVCRGARRTLILLLALAASAVALLSPATAARADGTTGTDLQGAQTLGDRELTVILRRVSAVPGPLHVDVLTHTGSPPGGPGGARSGPVSKWDAGLRRGPAAARPHGTNAHIQHRYEGARAAHPDDTWTAPRWRPPRRYRP